MTSVTVTAPAKLNLFLHVVGKRSDGYHLLESLVAFAEFGDTLHVEPSGLLSLEIAGPFAEALQQESHKNLVMRAATELRFRGGTAEGARMLLEKNIPIAAGMGGGSSDAATAIDELCRLWKLWGIDDIRHGIATALGADVKMCLKPKNCFVQGIGEKITPVSMAFDMGIVLVSSGTPLPTESVFKKLQGPYTPKLASLPSAFASAPQLIAYLADKRNDLQETAVAQVPEISDALHALRSTLGCGYAAMTGSGATCFGLYEDIDKSMQAAQAMRSTFPSWWIQATRLRRPQ